MKKSLKFVFGLVLATCLVFALHAQQPAPSLPQRDQVTIQDLKDQIADCSVTARAESNYEAKLIARIAELEKQVAALKNTVSNPPPRKE